MKILNKYLSEKCSIAAIVYFMAFLILPVKVVLVLTAVYAVAHALDVFKAKFPDTWDLEENEGDFEKSHRVFLTVPTSIGGKWYIFCRVNRTIINGETSLSLDIN